MFKQYYFTTRWRGAPLQTFKYIDDQTFIETAPLSAAASKISTQKEERNLYLAGCTEAYQTTQDGARVIGMELNAGKTQILCISDAINYNVSSFIKVGQEIMESQQEIKILGYTFGQRPDTKAQVAQIKKQGAWRAWSIRHLKRAGVPVQDLTQIYCSFVRSAIEYASVVYGCHLTEEQSDDIERIQANILRNIFGQRKSYRTCLGLAGIPLLKSRRELAFLKFTKRVEGSERFRAKWLPLNEKPGYDLRTYDKYQTTRFRSNRLRDSPIYKMRDLLNLLFRGESTIAEEVRKCEERIETEIENDRKAEGKNRSERRWM